jgi:outer membrane receptor protein involved in Fe transport
VSAEYQRYYTTDRARDSIFYFEDSIPANLDARYIDVAPVADVQWEITPALSVGLGGRVDWISYRSQQRGGGPVSEDDRVIASPKLSALYRFTEAWSAYASFNGGFRSSDGVIATPELPPALEYASEIGVRYSGRHAEGAIAFFLINVSNQQTVNPVTLLPDSSGTTRQQGVELSGRVALERWLSLFVQAVVNDAHYVRLMADTVNLAGVPVYQVARSVVQAGIDVQEGLIEGSLWMTYTGAWTPVNQPDVRTSPYTLVNLRAAFPISGPWSGAMGVRNMFDAKYVEVQASGYVSPGQPRGILVTVRHGF